MIFRAFRRALLCGAVLVFCVANVAPMSHASPVASASAQEKEVVRGNNRFTWRMYRFRRERVGDNNLFVSPYSLYTAFAMTYAGAKGETAHQLATTFSYPTGPSAVTALSDGLSALRAGLVKRARMGNYALSIANALWIGKQTHLLPAFTTLVKKRFNAECQQIDFTQLEAARQQINRYISKQTHDRIKEIVGAGVLTPSTPLVLANAVYFKASWMKTFDKRNTQQQPFHALGGKTARVSFMHQTSRYEISNQADCQILSLPYQRDDLSMIIVLPKLTQGLGAIERTISSEKVETWLKAAHVVMVNVEIPRFKLEDEIELNKQAAARLGMPLPFSRKADFSDMATNPMNIDVALHKAFIEVTEEGTEATAATVITVMKGAISQPEPPLVLFRADHPFLFMIRDNRTNAILFVGRVTQL